MSFAAPAVLVLVSNLPAAPSSNGAADDTLSRVRQRGELTWGGDVQGGEPYVFEDPKDPKRLVGFEVEIADAIGRRLGVRARFKQADWSTLVPALEREDFDVVMNGLEDGAARRERILVSHPYFVFGETLAIRRGGALRSLGALQGKRVATLNQSFADELLRRRGFEPILYEGVEEPYADLEIGRVDAVLLDHIIADRYGCEKKHVECLPDDVARGGYIVGFRKGDDRLQTAVDDALGGMARDGELRRILDRWKLWDARQDAPTAGAAPAPPTPPRAFGLDQARLFLGAALVTLGLSLAAFGLAVPLGLALALGRLGQRAPLRWAASLYVEVLRGTPLLLQLYVIYFALAPLVRLDPIVAAVLGLALNYAAYEAEIHRGALLSLPSGQTEAARALGLGPWQTLRHVTLPQAFRVALPSMTNDFVALLKDSSLVSVITVVELTKRMTIAAVDLRNWVVPGVACAALYFAMSYPIARLARRFERSLRRDHHPEPA